MNRLTETVEVCVHQCFFSPDWLVGLLRCCGGGVLWFLTVWFSKRHLVPPPPLYILKQVITPPPANPMFALSVSLTGRQTRRQVVCLLSDILMGFKLRLSTVVVLLWKQRSRDKIERQKSDWAEEGKYSVVLCTDGKVYRSQDMSPRRPSPCLVSMEMLTSRLLLLSGPVEKGSVHLFHRPRLLQPPCCSPQPIGVRHNGTIPLCVCVSTYTHSSEEEEREEEEEVPEGGECGVLVWFLFKLLLQYRLFFHWLLCGPADSSKSDITLTSTYITIN